MAIKNVFDTMKRGGYIIKNWEEYLIKKQDWKDDRAFNVNAPSLIGSCIRSRYYARMGYPSARISAKAERIFNNGSYVHERIQKDLKSCGLLLMDEVPVFNQQYQIQGHTDGIIQLPNEIGVLEIKSINLRNFTELKKAKDEHIMQGLTYLYCIEEHRKVLRNKYPNSFTLNFAFSWDNERKIEYSKMYDHLVDGSHFTRQEKLDLQLSLHRDLDRLLYYQDIPVTKAIFLYECKDNQEVKEFVVDSTSKESQQIIEGILSDCEYLNTCIKENKLPERPEGAKKSCNMCRWCNYQNECFVV